MPTHSPLLLFSPQNEKRRLAILTAHTIVFSAPIAPGRFAQRRDALGYLEQQRRIQQSSSALFVAVFVADWAVNALQRESRLSQYQCSRRSEEVGIDLLLNSNDGDGDEEMYRSEIWILFPVRYGDLVFQTCDGDPHPRASVQQSCGRQPGLRGSSAGVTPLAQG
jgi:hypothetical protein